MSYPQGYLYQPPGSLALYSCPAYGASALAAPRGEDLATQRSSTGSAFSPYAGSAGIGFSSPLSYPTDPAPGFPSYMGSPYDPHPTGMAGALSYHPYGSPGYPYQLNDPAYRKNATRDATATLKAWLQEHRKNPYPTKGEKIMLAIITKMTLTQVSTWFANARRRLKKENKMTWAPRNKSEDEEEDDAEAERREERAGDKHCDSSETSAEDEGISLHVDALTDHSCSAESDGEKGACRTGERDKRSGHEEGEGEEEDRELLGSSPKPVTASPRTGLEAPLLGVPQEERLSSAAPKPKLWSLAEIATSDQKQQHQRHTCSPITSSSSSSSPSTVYSASSILGRPLYYTAPFYGNYTNYSSFSTLQGQGILRYGESALKLTASPLEQHFRSGNVESKKDTAEPCTVASQAYLSS